jgi:hypothetical protein
MIRLLKSRDKIRFIDFCKSFSDKYYDVYITLERERKFLNEPKIATITFNNIMKRGDKAIIYEENETIKGILIIVGYSDHFPRKYVKCLANDIYIANKLFRFLNLNYNGELFMKLKQNNPLCEIIKIHKFEQCAFRGKELLFIKNGEINDTNIN